MNLLKLNLLATQISNGSRHLFSIDARSLITSTVMIKNYKVPGAPGSGRSGRKGPVKKTGKPLEKFGATSEEGYFQLKQKEQLEKLKKELKKKMPMSSRKDDKSLQLLKLTKKKLRSLSKKKKPTKNIFAGLLSKPKRQTEVTRKQPKK